VIGKFLRPHDLTPISFAYINLENLEKREVLPFLFILSELPL